MSNRENQEREARLQPQRIETTVNKLTELGINIVDVDNTTVCFIWKGHKCKMFAYSGWHCGKTIKNGRGLDNLLKQLK